MRKSFLFLFFFRFFFGFVSLALRNEKILKMIDSRWAKNIEEMYYETFPQTWAFETWYGSFEAHTHDKGWQNLVSCEKILIICRNIFWIILRILVDIPSHRKSDSSQQKVYTWQTYSDNNKDFGRAKLKLTSFQQITAKMLIDMVWGLGAKMFRKQKEF